MMEFRFIEKHGRVVLSRGSYITLGEHWIVNGQRFNHEPSTEEIEQAYTRAASPALDLDALKQSARDKYHWWMDTTPNFIKHLIDSLFNSGYIKKPSAQSPAQDKQEPDAGDANLILVHNVLVQSKNRIKYLGEAAGPRHADCNDKDYLPSLDRAIAEILQARLDLKETTHPKPAGEDKMGVDRDWTGDKDGFVKFHIKTPAPELAAKALEDLPIYDDIANLLKLEDAAKGKHTSSEECHAMFSAYRRLDFPETMKFFRAALAKETADHSDLIKRLNIKADMIQMGENIAWGSDSEIMREAALALSAAPKETK